MEKKKFSIIAGDMVGFSRLIEEDELNTIKRQKVIIKDIINKTFNFSTWNISNSERTLLKKWLSMFPYTPLKKDTFSNFSKTSNEPKSPACQVSSEFLAYSSILSSMYPCVSERTRIFFKFLINLISYVLDIFFLEFFVFAFFFYSFIPYYFYHVDSK